MGRLSSGGVIPRPPKVSAERGGGGGGGCCAGCLPGDVRSAAAAFVSSLGRKSHHVWLYCSRSGPLRRFRRRPTIHDLVCESFGGLSDDAVDLSDLLLKQDSNRSFGKHYEMTGKIGKGGFGSVYKAKSRTTGEVRAAKVMAKSAAMKDMSTIVTELEALIRLRHPNIVSFFEFFEEEKAICIVTELCDGGDFAKLGKDNFPEEEIRMLFRDVFCGVAYIHANGVAHRDLKFENCLVCEGPTRKLAKVIDFGLSAIRREDDNDEWLHDSLGTKYYVAPEVIESKRAPYGVSCDLWSLGVMIYITLTQEHPFAAKAHTLQTRKLFEKILLAPLRTEPFTEKNVSHDAREIMEALLERRPSERLSCQDALQHQWLRPAKLLEEMETEAIMPRTMSGELAGRMFTMGETSRFQRVILLLTAHHAKLAEVENLRMAFAAQDQNGDGQLSLDELKAGIASCGLRFSDEELRSRFNSLDVNHNTTISFPEWLSATIEDSVIIADTNIRELFDYFDHDRDGNISKNELRNLLSAQEAKQVLSEGDTSHDGLLDIAEFKELVLALARLRHAGGATGAGGAGGSGR